MGVINVRIAIPLSLDAFADFLVFDNDVNASRNLLGWVCNSGPSSVITLDGSVFMLRSNTRIMGHVMDVVWYDLGVMDANGSVTYPFTLRDANPFFPT